MADAARVYASDGMRIFPVNERKEPLTKHGFKDATTNIDTVTQWWDLWPDAGIAAPTGKATGRVVLDVDVKAGRDGEATLRRWEEKHGPLPHTLTAATGGGGRHVHFAYPEGIEHIPSGTNVLGPGVDVRADGGYVVLPPSSHASGGVYHWIKAEGTVLEGLPEALLAALLPNPGSRQAADVPPDRRFTGSNPCPVCSGGKDDPEGRGLRCWGFLSSDRRYAHCTREENSQNLAKGPDGTFAHRLGPDACRCGKIHAAAADDLKRDKAPGKAGISLRLVRDLLNEPEEAIQWVVDGLLPTAGLSLIAAKPKVGKSTLARQLAVSVARGEPFLGRATVQGPVIYLGFEEKKSEALKHFSLMGVQDEPIHTYFGGAPQNAIDELRRLTSEVRPVLIIVDTLFRIARIKDANDYAQVTNALEPLLTLARATGAHVLVIHHSGKNDREGPEAILGSTAIFGTVDTAILLRRGQRYRTIVTDQRYGTSLEATVLAFDKTSRTASLGEGLEATEEQRIRADMSRLLIEHGTPASEPEILGRIQGSQEIKRRVLREKDSFTRTGKGRRGAPYLYWPVEGEAPRTNTYSEGNPESGLSEHDGPFGSLSRGESLTVRQTERTEVIDSRLDILPEPFRRRKQRNRKSQPLARYEGPCRGFDGTDPEGPCQNCDAPQLAHSWQQEPTDDKQAEDTLPQAGSSQSREGGALCVA
jgi:hypothetical protein